MTRENDSSLTSSLIASCLIHILAILSASALVASKSQPGPQNVVPINLVDTPRVTEPPAPRKEQKPTEVKKPPAPPPPKPKIEKKAEPKPEREIKKPPAAQPASPPAHVPAKEEPAKPPELAMNLPPGPAPLSPTAPVEGGGSEAGTGNLFGKGDVGVVPGAGTSGGGGGTAASGLGRGSGIPGLPAATVPLRTNREATPIQTVRASYPPMALRMGLESDVLLKIEVDAQGKVTKAEILKSGGAGFDEEALKAVKQARFEPAQKDGKSIAAEFTYVYRFRLSK
jgi:protein TonB